MFVLLLAASLPVLALGSAVPPQLVARQSASGAVQIHPTDDASKCLTVSNQAIQNDQAVVIAACDSNTAFQSWLVPVAGGSDSTIQLATAASGVNYCLDAGDKGNGFYPKQMKIYQCYGTGLQQQDWVATPDQHYALNNQNPGFCLAAQDGSYTNAYLAGCGGPYQTWTTTPVNTPTSAGPVPSPAPTAAGVRIRPTSDNNKCLTVANKAIKNDQAVVIAACDSNAAFQRWVVPVSGQAARTIQLATAGPDGKNYCLDAGTKGRGFYPKQMKIYTCYPGLEQQQWVATPDKHFALANQNPGFCLAAQDGSYNNAWLAGCGGNFQTWRSD